MSSQALHEVMNDTHISQELPLQTSVSALLLMLPCLLFLYVNSVMAFALLRKPLLLESSRYILFGHLLFTDSLQLVVSMLLYIFAVTMVRIISYICFIFTLLAATTVKMSPLNLAVMSLERYVAICFPLRHANISTVRSTGIAIAVMWTVASLDSFMQLILFVSLENRNYTTLMICTRSSVLRPQLYIILYRSFTIMYFVLVSIIIIYTYAAIMITARSASSCVRNASKAHKTVLLHLLQLCLCLTSALFNMINSSGLLNVNAAMAIHIQYILFICLIIFPKCLSPLLYGLRDQPFRRAFTYYFTFGLKTTIRTYPKFLF